MKACTVLWRNLSHSFFVMFFLALCLLPAHEALGQTSALEQIVSLSKAALADYDDFELEAADSKISKAVELVENHALSGVDIANVYLAQGVIGYGRFKDSAYAIAEDRAFSAFLNAVAQNPEIVMPVDYATAELEAILANAKDAVSKKTSTGVAAIPPSVSHSPIALATRCAVTEVSVRIPSHPDVYRVMLYYQGDDSGRFDSLEMQPDFSDTSKLSAVIPASENTGDALLYYVEVYDRQALVVASVGSKLRPIKTALSGECAASEAFAGDNPIFQMSFAVGTGIGIVKGMTENCNNVTKCSPNNDYKGVGLGVAPVPLFLRGNVIFNLPQGFQLGAYLRGQVVNIVKDKVEPHIMVGLAVRYLVLNEQPFRLYLGLEVGWGGANATVFLGSKFNDFRDIYVIEGPFHVAPQIGFLWSFHKNVGLLIDLTVPIHFPTSPRVHFDLSVGPFFQF